MRRLVESVNIRSMPPWERGGAGEEPYSGRVKLRSTCEDHPMRFALRAASAADVDGLLALWAEAAENDSRPPDTRVAVTAMLDRDPDAVIIAEHDGQLIGSIIAG